MRNMMRFYTVLGWIAVAYMTALFLYPVCKVVYTSVWVNGSFSLANYVNLFSADLYSKVLLKTLWVSVISTLIALFIGYTLAYFITTRPASKQGFWLMLIISPMFMSLTIRLFGWMILLSKEGPIAKGLSGLFGGSETSLLFSQTAVVIGIVHFVLPFIVLNIYTSLNRLESSLIEASTMLGASRLRTFWKVTFPLSLPGVFAGSSIAFALAASTFLVPIMMGGPSDNLLANMAYNSIVTIGNMGMGAALSFVLLVIIVAVLLVMGRLERRGHIAS
ncbi:ABC transporter permease [Brevibacillus humidisoli]|uniref:ABC transporter permease n=1 Tax=Brevibacillus humidisoli TaxID=2895522 RepID=UPI001E2972F0|nr:ABC transporter permease [Brevibacillus humidisoli]UFJ41845.1 ABC transporter permease [Brevibacillus humidisoli]